MSKLKPQVISFWDLQNLQIFACESSERSCLKAKKFIKCRMALSFSVVIKF